MLRSPAGYRLVGKAASGASTVFGEMALFQWSARSTDVVSDNEVSCRELRCECFDEIHLKHPTLAEKLMGNLASALAMRLRSTNADLRMAATSTTQRGRPAGYL